MAISVTEPVTAAIERTQEYLFKPFDIGKWFIVGFTCFLAYLGEGGGASFNFPTNLPRGAGQWIQDNIGMIITIAVILVILGVVLGILFTWLSSRGKFMFLYNIVHDRAEVKAPWEAFRQLGNDLFVFRLIIMAIAFVVFIVLAAVPLLIAIPDFSAGQFTGFGVLAIILGVLLLFIYLLCFGMVAALLNDFVVPIMYIHNMTTRAAFKHFIDEIGKPHFWMIVLFYLFKFLLGMGIGMIEAIAMCLTCLIAALPYLRNVILLPLFVFRRCYPLYFLQQFGPGYRVFYDDDPYTCLNCGYDLRGSVGQPNCPECGAATAWHPDNTPPEAPPTSPNLPPPPPPAVPPAV